MTDIEYKIKSEQLIKLRKQYKFKVVYEDEASKILAIKELIEILENELNERN